MTTLGAQSRCDGIGKSVDTREEGFPGWGTEAQVL